LNTLSERCNHAQRKKTKKKKDIPAQAEEAFAQESPQEEIERFYRSGTELLMKIIKPFRLL